MLVFEKWTSVSGAPPMFRVLYNGNELVLPGCVRPLCEYSVLRAALLSFAGPRAEACRVLPTPAEAAAAPPGPAWGLWASLGAGLGAFGLCCACTNGRRPAKYLPVAGDCQVPAAQPFKPIEVT
jgi:hypothetical protein